MRYQLRATDTLTQHATHAMEQWHASVGADYPAWIDADDSGLICHDCGIVFVDAVSSDTYGDTAAQLAAYRAADFFGQARAARDAIAQGAYPTLSATPVVRTPVFSNGVFVGRAYGRIVTNLAPTTMRVNPPYLIQLHSGKRVAAFSRELELA